MPHGISSYTAAELAVVVLSAVLAVLLAIMAYRSWKGSRITPAERERRRCARLVAMGKMGDAALVEIQESVIFYSYAVRGVEYTASQDLTLIGRTPVDMNATRSLSVKYDPRNPANSIVISEEWSGVHTTEPRPSGRDLLNQSPNR